jgi:hypothetical protein
MTDTGLSRCSKTRTLLRPPTCTNTSFDPISIPLFFRIKIGNEVPAFSLSFTALSLSRGIAVLWLDFRTLLARFPF